jgi:hypothetical protein
VSSNHSRVTSTTWLEPAYYVSFVALMTMHVSRRWTVATCFQHRTDSTELQSNSNVRVRYYHRFTQETALTLRAKSTASCQGQRPEPLPGSETRTIKVRDQQAAAQHAYAKELAESELPSTSCGLAFGTNCSVQKTTGHSPWAYGLQTEQWLLFAGRSANPSRHSIMRHLHFLQWIKMKR